MWFLYGECKIFLDIKLDDLANPMESNRNKPIAGRPETTIRLAVSEPVFRSKLYQFGKTDQLSHNHWSVTDGDLTSDDAI
jgi:hypothetical protein